MVLGRQKARQGELRVRWVELALSLSACARQGLSERMARPVGKRH